jgi:flagellar motor switch protein FliN/FliY
MREKVGAIEMMMMMSLSAEAADTLKKQFTLLLEAAGKGLSETIGLKVGLQPLDFVDNPQLADVPDLFEAEAPLLAHTTVREGGGLKLPLSLLLKSQQAKVLANYMLGGSGVSNENPLSAMEQSAAGEAVNQMMNVAFAKLSASFTKRVDVASSTVSPFKGEEQLAQMNPLLLNQSVYSVHGNFSLTDGSTTNTLDFVALLPLQWAESFVSLCSSSATVTTPAVVAQPEAPPLFDISGIMAPGTTLDSFKKAQQEAAISVGAIGAETENTASRGGASGRVSTPPSPNFNAHNPVQSSESVTVQPVQFGSLESSVPVNPSYDQSNLNLMLDIKINLHVELGRTSMNIKQILELGRGAVLELDRLAGEPVDLFANGKLIARGEVVVIDDNFGLRVTNIVSLQERLKV